ncbi:MAG: hypothetical protein RL411_550 [Bacteroidota bacterium]|jgi:hypothetical protein
MILAILKHHPQDGKIKSKGFSILLLTIIGSFLLPNTSIAQRLSLKQQMLIEKTIQPILQEEAGKHEMLMGKGAFVQLGQDTLLNIHGLRYLFKITGDTVIRLDKSVYHGSNYYRYLFEYNGRIFTLGGYGQFVTNNNLESFNFDSKEWYLVKTSGQKPSFIKGCVIRVKDQLYLFSNSLSGNSIEDDISDPYFYQLDLPSLTWKRFPIVQSELQNFQAEIILYTTDYILVLDNRNAMLIHPKTLEFIQVTQEELGIKTSYQNISVDNNSLFFSNDIHHPSNENLPGVSMVTFWNNHKSKAKKIILNPSYFQQYPKEISIAILVGVNLIVIVIFISLKNRVKRKKQTPLIQRIILHNSKTLTTEELDQLLGIDHMELESRKAKRHRILAQIDVASPGLINRIKDESDKRRFVYFVSRD